MSKSKTFDKMTIRDLINAYHVIIEAFEKKRYTPDQPGYNVMEARLQNIENELRERKPEYIESLKDKQLYKDVLDAHYTIDQTGEVFNITRQTVYNWINNGILPIKKIAGKTYITKTAVERILKNGKHE